MIVQNIIYPEISEEEKELFFRGNALTDKNGILHLQAGEKNCFDTYMNVFDAGSGENIQALQIGRFLSRHVEMEEFLCIVFYEGTRTLVSFKEICEREDVK